MLRMIQSAIAIMLLWVLALQAKTHHNHALYIEGYHVSSPTPGYDPTANPLPGMPPILDPKDIYAAGRPGNLSPVVRGFHNLIYVPNSDSDTVDVIDPRTFRIVNHFVVGHKPQHVTPSWDLRTLWVLNDKGRSEERR